MSDTILAALIGGFFSIVAALIPIIWDMIKKSKKKSNWQLIGIIAVIALFGGFALSRIGINYYRNHQAKFVVPYGTKIEQQAKKFEVDNYTQIKWEPGDRVMTVQTYRNYKLVNEYKNAQSGDNFVLGTEDTGATEIKMWDEASGKQLDQIWVWTKNARPFYCAKSGCPGHSGKIDKCAYYCAVKDCPGHANINDKCAISSTQLSSTRVGGTKNR